MKLIILFIFTCAFFSLNAQVEYSIENSTKSFQIDLSDPFHAVRIEKELFNNTDENLNLKWEVFKTDVPEEWRMSVITEFLAHSFELSTNTDPNLGIVPFEILASDSSEMSTHLQPKGVAGCGTYEIRISTVDDPSTILASGFYNFVVNVGADCIVTSTNDFEKSQIQIYPNPAHDYFFLSENTSIEEVQIFNLVGKRMMEIPFQDGEEINISNFPNGLYFVKLLDGEGELFNTIRLVKN